VSTLARVSAETVRRTFAPPTKLTVSQWVDRHGWIARGSGASEGGPYSTDRVPYMREILDVMGDERSRDVVFNKPAQVGFTEAVIQFVGYCMAEDPSGLIVVQPDIERAKAWMKERVDPMLAESPRLKGVVRSENGRRTSDDTLQRKIFPGGYLVAIGANSPSGMRSRPSRRVLGDERSGWTLDARSQGDPWDLLGERTATFWNAKRIQGSTPGEEGVCPITAALAASDNRKWCVPCPSCGFTSPFQWRADDGTYRLVCERGAANELIPASARYLCTACGTLIPEHEKARMNRGGKWIATNPESAVVGFDLGNSLMSPWRSWADVMDLWLKAQGNQERLKVFVTHVLAEPWRPVAERIDVHSLMERAEPVADLPPWVGAVTGAVDIQGNRLETLRVGWGAGEEAIVLEWSQHEGDPTKPEAWSEAREALGGVNSIAVDTGYLTDVAWSYVDQWGMTTRTFGVKGMPGRPRPIMGRPLATSTKRARRPWLVGVDAAKDALALRLRASVPPGGSGAVHFADTLAPEFFEQLTSEELRPAIVGGRPTRVWRLRPGMRNEGLDLLVYALAALHGLGPHTLAALGAMAAARAAAAPQVTPEVTPQGVVVPREIPRPPRTGWVSSGVPRRRW
jgi:phage terminase large subunit GpA-like protein